MGRWDAIRVEICPLLEPVGLGQAYGDEDAQIFDAADICTMHLPERCCGQHLHDRRLSDCHRHHFVFWTCTAGELYRSNDMQCCLLESDCWSEHFRLLDSLKSPTDYNCAWESSIGLQFFGIGSGWSLVFFPGMADQCTYVSQ